MISDTIRRKIRGLRCGAALFPLLLTAGAARSDAPASRLAPIPTPNAGALSAPATPTQFSFVVAGDNRSTGHGHPMPPAFDEICQEIGLVHPGFVLWGGDVIEGYDDTLAEADAEYDTFLASAAKTGVPFFNAPGNHEFGGNPALIPVYEKRLGRLYGSFDYGNSHFIALNTDPLAADGKSILQGTLDDAQLTWLEADLKASQGATNRFVSMHHYVFGPADDDPAKDTGFADTATRDRLHALFVKYKVRAVFCSHNHRYWHTVRDGIDYFISGGAGAPLDAEPTEGGYLHFLLLTVEGDKIVSQILQPWHLDVAYPQGATAGFALAENTNRDTVTVNALPLRAPLPGPGETLTVTATVPYKAKIKTAAARIVTWKPDPDGKTADVIVSADLPPARGTEILVTPTRSK